MSAPRRAATIFVAALVVAGGSYLLPHSDGSGSPTAAASRPVGLAGMKSTDEQIALWRGRYEEDSRDFISLTYLGATLIQKGRESGDLGAYERAAAALRKVIEIRPGDAAATAYLGVTLFATHDFAAARDLAARAFVSDTRALQALATVGDADLELGDYAAAEIAYRQLADRGALGAAVDSRLARLAWLRGHADEAISLMRKAADEAIAEGAAGEGAAWYEAQLADLSFRGGQLEDAAGHFLAALEHFDGYHVAVAGLARVRAAQGRLDEAIGLYRRAIAVVPYPEYVAALGDLYALRGEARLAHEQYATVEAIATLGAVNRQVYDRQLAVFDADHDRSLAEALRIAEGALASRRDIFGYDAYAWTLYKNGRYTEARAASDAALSLGTNDAMLLYHSGSIALALGDTPRGRAELIRALELNPGFDLVQASRAREALIRLGRD